MTTEEKAKWALFLLNIIAVAAVGFFVWHCFGDLPLLGYLVGCATVLFCLLLDTL